MPDVFIAALLVLLLFSPCAIAMMTHHLRETRQDALPLPTERIARLFARPAGTAPTRSGQDAESARDAELELNRLLHQQWLSIHPSAAPGPTAPHVPGRVA